MTGKRDLIRFVVHREHEDSGERCGLFQAINMMLDSDESPEHLRPAIQELFRWFNQNLRNPFRSDESIKRSIVWWREHQAARTPDLFPLVAIVIFVFTMGNMACSQGNAPAFFCDALAALSSPAAK